MQNGEPGLAIVHFPLQPGRLNWSDVAPCREEGPAMQNDEPGHLRITGGHLHPHGTV